MKKTIYSILSVVLVFTILCFVGCSKENGKKEGNNENATKAEEIKIPDLVGEWKQINSESEDAYQSAVIKDNTIEIYWVSDGGDTKSLYWAGTFVAPTSDKAYSWESQNDHEKTDSALLASQDDTKTIKYDKGTLSYEASAFGTTKTIKLEKQ